MDGIIHLVRSQRNAWVHLMGSVVVIALGARVRLEVREWCWLLAAMGMVWVAEALNTAVEILCDVVCAERHAEIGRVKDVAAGAVLIAAIAAAVVGIVIFGSHL